jgi:hypothetical protein
MPMVAHAAPLRQQLAGSRPSAADANDPGTKDDEDGSRAFGNDLETMPPQNAPTGQVATVVHEANNVEDALASLRGMTDALQAWYWPTIKDASHIEIGGSDGPPNDPLGAIGPGPPAALGISPRSRRDDSPGEG